MRKINKKYIGLLLAFLLLFTIIPVKQAKAMDISLAVNNSKIYDENIMQGESKTYTLGFANKSANVTKKEYETLSIDIKAMAKDNNGKEIKNIDNIISLSKTSSSLKIEEIDTVDATISIPKDYEDGYYIFTICFIMQPIEGLGSISQTNEIDVPIYVFVGDHSKWSNKEVKYSVLDNYLIYGDEPTTILKESLNSFVKCLNPIKIPSTFKDIKNKPIYNFKTKNGQILDVNSNIYTKLKNVVTTGKTSDTKYVKYNKEYLNKKVANVKIGGNKITILLENDKKIEVPLKANSLVYVRQQLEALLNQSDIIVDLQYLFDNLNVPCNKNYDRTYPILATTIQNNGDTYLTVKGDYSLYKDGELTKINVGQDGDIEKGTICSPTIETGGKSTIKNLVTSNQLLNGEYTIKVNLNTEKAPQNITKSFSYSFTVKSYRQYVIILTIIMLAILYLLIAIILYLLLKKHYPKLLIKNNNKYKKMKISKIHWDKKIKTYKNNCNNIDIYSSDIILKIDKKKYSNPEEINFYILVNNEREKVEYSYLENGEIKITIPENKEYVVLIAKIDFAENKIIEYKSKLKR